MDLPELSDDTVVLRPFGTSDIGAAVMWLAGPQARTRSYSDGGPVASDAANARAMAEDLCNGRAWAVVLDGETRGAVALRPGSAGQATIQVTLAESSLWAQGIGGRVLRLSINAALGSLGIQKLLATGIDESSEPARIAWENCGFGLVRRYEDGNKVRLDLSLSALCHRTREQQVMLVASAATETESQGRVLGLGSDQPLSRLGRAQAESLAASALLATVTEVVTSPLKRARATAEAAWSQRGIPITLDELWTDRDWGNASEQVLGNLPRNADGSLQNPPGGESETELIKRAKIGLSALPMAANIAIVTHPAVIAALVRGLWPALAEAPGLRSGGGITSSSITELRRGPEDWRCIRLADDRHTRARRATTELV